MYNINNKMFTRAIFILSLVTTAAFTAKTSALDDDFCVADSTLRKGPGGFPCKDPTDVVPGDFVAQLGNPGNTSNTFGSAVTPAISPDFPGVNGLGISIARVDFADGGVQPFHTHRATEVLYVSEGWLLAAFVCNRDQVYINSLREGDAMVFPKGCKHFQINIGGKPAVAIASYNSADGGSQYDNLATFGNTLPTGILNLLTNISVPEITRLKSMFNGTN